MSIADRLMTSVVKQLTPYQSARRLFASTDSQGDWLNANESPFANDFSTDSRRFNRYPDCQPPAVVASYAAYTQLEQDQVLVSRGADEGIELLIRAFCQPGTDHILICPPTYGMYAISAQTFNVGVKQVPLKEDFQLDVDGIIEAEDTVKLVFICAPNNPTGTLPAKNDIVQVIEHYADKALVVIDEAYIEFSANDHHVELLNNYPNVVILRTLSKAFALAGLRCGFTLAQGDVIAALLKVIAPYPLAEPVAQIAAQALSQDGLGLCQQQVSFLQNQQTRLLSVLETIPNLSVVGAQNANFILIRCQHKDSLMAALVAQGILIRDQSKQYLLDDCLRISIGNEGQNSRLIQAITTFYQDRQELS